MGVVDEHEIAICESDEGHVNTIDVNDPGKMCAFYHNVARHYGIARTEYESMLPEIPEPELPTHNQYESPRRSGGQCNLPVEVGSSELIVGYPSSHYKGSQNRGQVPAEYRDDPDLWYAIQASTAPDTGAPADHPDVGNDSADTEKRWKGEPKIERSALDTHQTRKTRAEHGASLRETKAAEYEAKRNHAKSKMEQA